MNREDIKLGIALPTWAYNPYREYLIKDTFESLTKVKQPMNKPTLLLLKRIDNPTQDAASLYQLENLKNINLSLEINGPAKGTEATLAYGTKILFDMNCTHVIWAGDDGLFNSNFLIEVENLILRHPEATAVSCYHSAHQKYHLDLTPPDENGDIETRSLCGQGFTVSREKWNSFDIDWEKGNRWVAPGEGPESGTTIDLYIAKKYGGPFYCTNQSYINHIGQWGQNCNPDIPEYALNFVEEK